MHDATPLTTIRARPLGYQAGWELQRALARARAAGQIGDTLLLAEHPHTYTIGRDGDMGQLLVAPELLAARGDALLEVDRGGGITYHGPGQVVCYPIVRLAGYTRDVARYLRMLEEAAIRALADMGVAAGREPGLTGVWAGGAKVAAIGVKLSASGVAMHGVALNLDADMRRFAEIIPCGLRGRRATSVAELAGAAPRWGAAAALVERRAREVFAEAAAARRAGGA